MAAKLNHSTLSTFSLGPLTEARQWEGERAKMALDRGPCKVSAMLSEVLNLTLTQGAMLLSTSNPLD